MKKQISNDRAVIEKLRSSVAARLAAEPRKPTVEQVKGVVDDLRMCRPLVLTSATMDLATDAENEKFVLDIVAKFGTWLSHSIGRAAVELSYFDNEEQPALFHIVEDIDGGVKIPPGYEPWAPHKRDVTRALAAILHHAPTDDMVARFVSRTYGARQSVLSYPLVSGVWGSAVRGRLATIHQVSDDLLFLSQVVEAFDLLDVARADAVASTIRLVTENLSVDEAIFEAEKALWLAEKDIGSVLGTFQLVRAGKAPETAARRHVESLYRNVKAAPSKYLPQEVRELTLGQVQRVCAANGIKVDAGTRADETEIRATLKRMGLSADADRLVPQALRCAEQGDLPSFWSVMQARVEGDLSWAEQLDELIGA